MSHKRISAVERHLLEVLPDLTGLIDPLIKIIASYTTREFLHDPELYDNDTDIEFTKEFTAFKKTRGYGFTSAVSAALPPFGRHCLVFRFHGPPSNFSIVGLCTNPKVGGGYSVVGNLKHENYRDCLSGAEQRWGGLHDPVITMVVDFEEDTLVYLVNGVSYMDAICGLNLKSRGPLYPGVSLGDKEIWVEIE